MDRQARRWFPPEADDVSPAVDYLQDAAKALGKSQKSLGELRKDVAEFPVSPNAEKFRQETLRDFERAVADHAKAMQAIQEIEDEVQGIGAMIGDTFHSPRKHNQEPEPMFMSYASDSSDPVASTEQTAAFTVDRSLNIILSDYFAWEGPVPPAAVKGWKQAMAWIEKQRPLTDDWYLKVAKTFEQKFVGYYKTLQHMSKHLADQPAGVVLLKPGVLNLYSEADDILRNAVFNLVASKKSMEKFEQRQTGMKMAALKNEGRQVLAAFQAAVIARGGKF